MQNIGEAKNWAVALTEGEADGDQNPAIDRMAVASVGGDETPSGAHRFEGGAIEVVEAGGFSDFDLCYGAIGSDQDVQGDGAFFGALT